MPVGDSVFSGDQVRHDERGTFYEAINLCDQIWGFDIRCWTVDVQCSTFIFYLTPRLRNLVSYGDESGSAAGGADT